MTRNGSTISGTPPTGPPLHPRLAREPHGGGARVQVPDQQSNLAPAALASGPGGAQAVALSGQCPDGRRAPAAGRAVTELPDPGPFGPDLRIDRVPGAVLDGPPVDCGLAGTVMRFVPPVAALCSGTSCLDGDDAARVRPHGSRGRGAAAASVCRVEDGGRGTLPADVVGTGTSPGGTVTMMRAAPPSWSPARCCWPRCAGIPLVLRHDAPGGVPSLPHVEMTLQVLRDAGVSAERVSEREWRASSPGPSPGLRRDREPSLSNAGPFLAAAVATGGTVSIPDWPAHTTQGRATGATSCPASGCA
ncbi:hypothetical protein QJS66_23110 [Kocuria rhizophila]|nr:hypothetical protein QJS66_23110 [Kocuria rhizophila]